MKTNAIFALALLLVLALGTVSVFGVEAAEEKTLTLMDFAGASPMAGKCNYWCSYCVIINHVGACTMAGYCC
jgi:hypothetical protein